MPRTLAIGDIHGHLAHLDALLDAVAPTPEDHLVFLGDYIDRGPDSAGVLNRVMALSRTHKVSAIKGNHEQMMLDARSNHEAFFEWFINGGDAALFSYNGTRGRIQDVPPEHWHFLESGLVDYVETDSHIFVHASADPTLPMKDQGDYMLRWERCDTIAPHFSTKTIVCGHTPQKSGRPMNKGYALCLDTHVYGPAGLLTCLDCTSGKVIQVDRQLKVSRSHISDYAD